MQELQQVIIVKQFHTSIININPVNYYLMEATNKRLLISESHGDSNRCTPYRGKPDQHDTYASNATPRTPGVRFLWAVPVRGNFHESSTTLDGYYCSRKKVFPTPPLSPTEWSAGPALVSLPTQPMK
jgi:hypothetical protein